VTDHEYANTVRHTPGQTDIVQLAEQELRSAENATLLWGITECSKCGTPHQQHTWMRLAITRGLCGKPLHAKVVDCDGAPNPVTPGETS
jgi:hypothetical protein